MCLTATASSRPRVCYTLSYSPCHPTDSAAQVPLPR
jgi:hypothetical protein